jgi:hypothetical protein
MPKGPKGQKRPADVIGNAVLIMETRAMNSLPSLIPGSGIRLVVMTLASFTAVLAALDLAS